jgi:hypothetical protein
VVVLAGVELVEGDELEPRLVTLTTSGCAGLRWAKTSTSTVTQVCPTSTMAAWKLTSRPPRRAA